MCEQQYGDARLMVKVKLVTDRAQGEITVKPRIEAACVKLPGLVSDMHRDEVSFAFEGKHADATPEGSETTCFYVPRFADCPFQREFIEGGHRQGLPKLGQTDTFTLMFALADMLGFEVRPKE